MRVEDTDANAPVPYSETTSELRSFVERVERLEAEIREIKPQRVAVFAEAKLRGYVVNVLSCLIAERKRRMGALPESLPALRLSPPWPEPAGCGGD
jgi:uncharacterized protein (UPF0335 family)